VVDLKVNNSRPAGLDGSPKSTDDVFPAKSVEWLGFADELATAAVAQLADDERVLVPEVAEEPL
jgi:hypothetical protein